MSTLTDALEKFHAAILETRKQRHKEAIRELMLPTTSWFGLFKTQLSREHATTLHNTSLDYRFIEISGRRWTDEIEALAVLHTLGEQASARISNELINKLRAEGYL